MTASDQPTKAGSSLSPHGDIAEASAHLHRLTWTMRIVLLGLAITLWVVHVALASRRRLDEHDRSVGEMVLSTELAATLLQGNASVVSGRLDSAARRGDRELAEGRLHAAFDSLGAAVRADSMDRSAATRVAGVDSLLRSWDVRGQHPLDAVRFQELTRGLETLRRDERDEHRRRRDRFELLLTWSTAITVVSTVGLAIIVLQMRRRLARQLTNALEAHRIILQQNQSLSEKHSELQSQTAEVRAAAADSALLARRLAEAQRVAKLGYWEIAPGSREVFWSDEMYTLSGLDPTIKPPPTSQFVSRIHPGDRPGLVELATAAIESLSEFNTHYRLPSPDGTGAWRSMQARGRVVLNASGEQCFVGTVQDITERVDLEAQLRRSQKMEAVGQLAGGIAHDFNNVLTVIDGYCALLLANQPANSPARADIEEIRSAAARAATLTRQLLAFSRQQVLQPSVLDLNVIIGGIDNMLRRLIGEHIQIESRLNPSLDLIKADPGQLEQVIVNLIVNARDAMPNGGRLTIVTKNVTADALGPERRNAEAASHWVMLSIADTGVGIPSEDIDRIFDPFFTTKESAKGTGLGLSTVLGIVEQSGGEIRLETEPGKGTVFKLFFPRTDALTPAAASAPAADPPRTGSETILLVEDNTAVRHVASAALRRAGYTVVESMDGLDALRICHDESLIIDLVVTDMVMPAMGGRDLAIKLGDLRPTVPILFMSGYTRDAMIHSAALRPSESFIEKPFTPGILTQKVRDALEAAKRRETK
ncbi:MAG: ATP-binding protein [Gemmatimonadaceae bacterium]